jgi:hypothetical protein
VNRVSVARKLKHDITTAARPRCLFRRGDYRNKSHNPEKLLDSSPDEGGFCISETKHDKRRAPRSQFCFCGDVTGTKVTNPKTVLGWSPDEDVFCTLEMKDGKT